MEFLPFSFSRSNRPCHLFRQDQGSENHVLHQIKL